MTRTCIGLLALTFAAAPSALGRGNVVPFGDFETMPPGGQPDRPVQFWHRVADGYLSAFPAWRITAEQASVGSRSVTSTSTREFVMCGDGAHGDICGQVFLRAAEPGTKVRVRLSWWNRLRRTDETAEFEIGPEWRLCEVRTEARQGGPMELAVANLADGTRIWADDFRILAPPPPDQLKERVGEGEDATFVDLPIVQPPGMDFGALQVYGGNHADTEGEFALHLEVPEISVEIPCVSGGVPFPSGRLFRPQHTRVVDAGGREVAAQCEVLSRWLSDQSIRMLLVTVERPRQSTQYTLQFGPSVRPAVVANPLEVTESAENITVRTDGMVWTAPHSGRGPFLEQPGTTASWAPGLLDGNGTVFAGRTTSARVEFAGPVRALVAVNGEFRSEDGQRCGRYVTRYEFWRGRSTIQVRHCWINDERDPILPIRSAWFDVRTPQRLTEEGYLVQAMQGKYGVVTRERVPIEAPTVPEGQEQRHAGVFGAMAVRDFWQNHPCAFEATDDGARLWLWPDTVTGVLLPQGFARQWEFLLDASGTELAVPFQTTSLPLLFADPAWMCASGVFEFLLPPDPDTFPIFEQRVGQLPTLGRFSLAAKESQSLYGLFNYGDAPGDGGWSNLESMAAHELFLHWVRTGSREHFDMARLAAEHYRDIDIHHAAGFCHTHCNNHVHSGEGWSHSWIQGVRDLYFLLGDLRAFEVLQEVGERLLAKPIGWATGREWTRPIDNLVDIFGATGDTRFLQCVYQHVAELGRRQVPEHAICGAEKDSWYQDRYEAGCAFTWYGCQAMAKLHHEAPAPEVLRILRQEIDLSLDVATKAVRSYKVLPGTVVSEDTRACTLANPYALGRGSTLFPPLGYLAYITGETQYLDLGMNILAHCMLNIRGGSDASATSYATVFLHYAKLAGMGPSEEAAAFERARDFSFEQWPAGLINGGFEADHFEGWGVKKVPGQNFFYDDLVKVGYFLDEEVRRSGRRSLRFQSDNRARTMFVRGQFALEPKTRWRLALWIKSDPEMNPAASLALREYDVDRTGSVALRATGEATDGWQEYAGNFTTVSRTVATLTMTNRGGTGSAWFDDVMLENIGPAYSLLTNNGGGRNWRELAYPALSVDTGGSYRPDEPMTGDLQTDGRPISFAEGCLTDGNSRYDYRQKPLGSYGYWQSRPGGSIIFDLGRSCRVRMVRTHILIDERMAHGTQRIELRHGTGEGPVLGSIEPAANGWNEFDGLDVGMQYLTLVFTALEGRRHTTVSEVEIWGELEHE